MGMRVFSITANVQVAICNSSSSSCLALIGMLFIGHYDRCNLSHGGPYNHKSCLRSSEGNMPLDAQSVGFSSLTTWFQQSTVVSSTIWAIQFPTYTLNRRGFPWIQAKTIVESVYACMELKGRSCASLQ